nr:hypothetical protein [Tanacetum cinerariifolium]
MDDLNITMAEYIQLEEEKARRRGQEYNWETATHCYNNTLTSEPKVSIDFENKFPAIVYNDASISEPKISAEPTDLLKKLTTLVECFKYGNLDVLES